FVIEAFGTGIAFATFFIPGQLGVAEGGAVATFIALGLSAATGLSFSLVRRVREVTWIGIGLLLLAARPIPSPPSLRSEAACPPRSRSEDELRRGPRIAWSPALDARSRPLLVRAPHPVEVRHVVVEDELALGLRHRARVTGEQLARPRPRGVAVREVVGP